MADHERVNITGLDRSCGVMQLSRLDSDILPVLYGVAARLYHPARGEPCAYFVFSDVTGQDGNPSRELVKKVKKLGFGTIIETKPTENPRTGNGVIVYVWSIDHKSFKKWYALERVKKLKTVGT